MPAARPIYPIPPGRLLAEELEVRGVGPEDFAAESGIPIDALMALLEGSIPLTNDTAATLEAALGIDAAIWLGFEREYRRQIALLAQQPPVYRDEIGRATSPHAYPVPPGALLAEELEVRGLTPVVAADHLGCTVDVLMELFDGRRSITEAEAEAIEAWLEIPARVWLGLEREYRASLGGTPAARAVTG